MRWKLLVLTGFMAMFFVGASVADAAEDKPVLCIRKTPRPPVIDGKLDKGEWAGRGEIPLVRLHSGKGNASQPAKAFVTYDDKNLYFGVRCAESNIGKIKANVKEHNGDIWYDDDIEVFIDTNHDKISYHQYAVNSIGTQWDRDSSKKGAWKAAAKVYADHWVVEIAIPFTVLGITPDDGLVCGFNLTRTRPGKPTEVSTWSPQKGSIHAPARFGYLVFGTLKAAADRKGKLLRAQLDALTGETTAKAALLKQVKAMENLVRKGESFKVARYQAIRKSAAAIEKKIEALARAELVAKLTAGDTGKKHLLTSAAARSGYDVPGNWRMRKILGKEFWHDISYHRMPMFKQAGLADEPFIKNAMPAIRTRGSATFERVFFDPKSATRKMLKSTGKPFCVASAGGSFALGLEPSVCRRFIKEYGKQFAGFVADECFGHDARKKWPRMNLPMPKTRHEAFLGFAAQFLERRRVAFHNWALCYVEFRPWAICTFSTPLDHYALELGPIKMAGTEIGGHMKSMAMIFAFSRGASRQYDKPWRMYLAVFGPGVISDSTQGYRVLSPRCRNAAPTSFWDTGPNSGTSLSLQKRQILSAYMSGMNMFHDEGDSDCGSLYVANYDYRKIDSVDDLVIVLRDTPHCLSPAGAIRKEFHDNIVNTRDRGVIYTPVALIFDRFHGYMPKHYQDRILGVIPYKEADYMMRAVNQTLFPWEHRSGEQQAMVTGPFGDMFDVLTNNAESEVLSTYGAAMLVGNVEMNGYFVQRLIKYVENGGTLIINARQINGRLPEKFLGCKVTKKRGRGKIAFSNLDKSVIVERKPFNFQYLKPTTATTLVSLVEGNKKTVPLVLSNKYGKGRVIVTAPDYLKESGSKTQMLKLFSHLMRRLNSELLPVAVEGNVEYIVNRNKSGWVVTLINNEGVYKPPGQKPIVKSEENVVAKVILKRNAAAKVSKVSEWLTGKELKLAETPQGMEVTLTVPAGDVRIIEFAQ
ncbi:MAG: carbohydrate-binding family 9-like protein [Phycisphaerae bacterium]|nr:carbohydrate-binding family 9-like protein [Phycisphaerae bacterium]